MSVLLHKKPPPGGRKNFMYPRGGILLILTPSPSPRRPYGGLRSGPEEETPMKRNSALYALLAATAFAFAAAPASARPFADLEAGMVFSGYNDIRIPGDTGTKFSLHDDLEAETSAFFRVRLGYTLNERHVLSLLAAPLTVRYEGTLDDNVDFAGTTFPGGSDVKADFVFNSYRFTYRYDFFLSPRIEFGAGLTGKIRDAEIRLKSGPLEASKTNVGFVPLVNFRLLLRPQKKMGLLIEGDALASVQGRAEDVLFALTYDIDDRWSVRAGYRILEGGADNDEVYTFSLFNYTLFGVHAKL